MVSYAVHHTPHYETPRRRHHWWFVALAIVVAAIAAVVAVVFGGGAIYAGSVASTFDSHVSHIQQAFPASGTRPAATQTGAMNILLLGSDSRGAPTDVGSTGVSNQRADTMMLVHIDADRQNVYVISIMRDMWVPIPGNGSAKINAALAWGGTPLVVQTLEQLLGARIDHVAIVDFSGLKDMTNVLGGLDVDSPVAFTTVRAPHYSFVKGMNHVDGDQALAFARERYAFPTADYQRVADQQALIRAFGSKLMSFSVLTDPGKLTAFAAATGSYVSVDQGFGLQTMLGLAASMRLSGLSSIHTFTLPTAGTGTSADGQSIVNVDPAAIAQLRTALANDTLSTFTK
ncbi:LCP family protein [Leifsonia sp. fls2-241-R2A-40a]|uniref:LCP family protein n=1 Tax=Leifsonia sp. fls2-241-R2A-40a TaxID=3040290 RepID=UPI00254BA517|nr:LCP family protein [Leifsonia sp. fls2-241-R2A-40a]